ncbi:hypothetical protein FACS189490_13390 [Clostridia bacterium]|nr:hypothetical protein FACS189490_13390 [Clostridia bacterium]
MSGNIKVNPALTETAVAFDPQMPVGGIFGGEKITPPGVTYLDGERAVLRFYAPTANTVAVRIGWLGGAKVDMEKQEEGIWTVTVGGDELERGGDLYSAIFFEVDGVYVLNPMAPVAWGHAHHINAIDLPGGADYYHLKDVPHGTVTRDYYFSKSCNCVKSCLVYAPPGYMSGKGENLPVLYLQHGYGENETSWVHLGKVNFIMDNLIAEGKAAPCLIVMNNGMVQTEHGDGTRDWNVMSIERLLTEDCDPFIESNYRAAKGKWSRAMAGLSMGSMQTSVTTLNHPDFFGYVGIFSGFLGLLGDPATVQNDHFKAFDDKPALFSAYKLFFRCIGDRDQFLDHFNAESTMLKEKGLRPGEWQAHTEKFYSGGHDWNVWRACVRDFLSLIFK